MRPISIKQIYTLQRAPQYFQDCYLVSSINALTRCENGRKLLQRNISSGDGIFNIRFNDVKGAVENFRIRKPDLTRLIWLDYYGDPITSINGHAPNHNPIIKAIECAMNALIKKHPDKKPLLCRYKHCNYNFEFNKPSNFMSMFTGQKPIKLNEDGIRLSLRSKTEEALNLFEQMDKENHFSFVAGTSYDNTIGLADLHCYTVEGVNYNNKYMQILDNRTQESRSISFYQAIHNLKFLTGYFNNML